MMKYVILIITLFLLGLSQERKVDEKEVITSIQVRIIIPSHAALKKTITENGTSDTLKITRSDTYVQPSDTTEGNSNTKILLNSKNLGEYKSMKRLTAPFVVIYNDKIVNHWHSIIQ